MTLNREADPILNVLIFWSPILAYLQIPGFPLGSLLDPFILYVHSLSYLVYTAGSVILVYMLNPKFIGLDLSCRATRMPNYLLGISTWRKLRYQQLCIFESKRTFPLIFLSMASPSSLGTTASFSFICYIQAINKYLLTLSFLSTYPATTPVSRPLSSTRIISTAFSTGFLSPVLFGSSCSPISSY